LLLFDKMKEKTKGKNNLGNTAIRTAHAKNATRQ
jgi:hypothetical protein